jgi:hypothetical protein
MAAAWQHPRNPHMRIGWLVNEDNFERAMSLRNGSHLPTTTQCARAEFEDFAKQRNGGGGREKDLLVDNCIR